MAVFARSWGDVGVAASPGVIFERLTDRAREVLVGARLAAQQCRHRSIEAPHIVVGILRNRDTTGCQVLNQAGLRYVEILTTVQAMYQQTSENPDAPPVLSAQANRLLDDAMQEAVDRGCAFVETTHLALACSRADVPSSIKPLVAGREQAIRDAARGALEQSARLEDELRARRQTGASHLDGLERANVVRTRRAQLKRDLNNGRISMHEVLLDAPDFVQTAKVGDLLRAVPTYSRASVARILARCRITPDKTIQGLSPRQREALIESLRPA